MTDPRVRLKYQQLITNNFVEVDHFIAFDLYDFVVVCVVKIAVKILHGVLVDFTVMC